MLPTVGGEVGGEGAAAAVSVGEGRFLSALGDRSHPGGCCPANRGRPIEDIGGGTGRTLLLAKGQKAGR